MTQLWLATGDALGGISIDGDRCLGVLHLPGRRVRCVAVDPLQPQRVYCGTWGEGVFCSDDGGRQWRQVGEPLAGAKVLAIAVSRAERIGGHGVVYAGTEPSEVFRSEDAGETWRVSLNLHQLPSAAEWSYPPRPHTHHVRWIEADPHTNQRLWVAIEAGALVRSIDGAVHWQDRTSDGPRDAHQLATHLSAPARLYAAAGDGYFESRDGGDSWRRVEQGLQHRYVWSVAVDAGDADTIFVSAAAGPRQSHDPPQAESFLYRRTADGPWQVLHSGLPEPGGRRTAVLAAHPRETQTIFAAWENELYCTTNGGAHWQRLDVSWPAGFRVQEPHALVAATD